MNCDCALVMQQLDQHKRAIDLLRADNMAASTLILLLFKAFPDRFSDEEINSMLDRASDLFISLAYRAGEGDHAARLAMQVIENYRSSLIK